MELLDYSSLNIWKERRSWINNELENADLGSSSVSDHSVTLFMDMQIAFCSGAWISFVIMSISVIDSHLRETEASDNKIGTAKLLNEYYTGEDISCLRQLRNQYVHHNLERPIFNMNYWFNNQYEMEENARKAMRMTISVFWQSWGT